MFLSSSASIQNMLVVGTSFISAAITLQLHYKMRLTRPILGPFKMTWSSMQQRIKELRIDLSKSRGSFSQLYIGNYIEFVSQSKILGLITSRDIKWKQHVEYITGKASQWLHLLVLCRRAGVPSNEMLLMYISNIRPVLEYACAAWHRDLTQYLTYSVERVQFWARRIIFPGLAYGDALVSPQLPKLKERRNDICLSFSKSMVKYYHKLHHLLYSRTSLYSLLKPHKYESAQTKVKRADGALVIWCPKHLSNSI